VHETGYGRFPLTGRPEISGRKHLPQRILMAGF
jgi:hypothetical protein